MAEHLHYDFCDTSLGECLIAVSTQGICHLDFTDGNSAAAMQRLQARLPGTILERRDMGSMARAALDDAADVDHPVDLRGTPFQQSVWQALRRVPRGTTISYGQLARRIGRPGASRAVAGAVARNAVAGLVPCHRVIRADGGLGGFRWGTGRKAQLLQRERNVSP